MSLVDEKGQLVMCSVAGCGEPAVAVWNPNAAATASTLAPVVMQPVCGKHCPLQFDARELAKFVLREMPGVIRSSTGMRH